MDFNLTISEVNYLPKYFPKEVQHQGTNVLHHSSSKAKSENCPKIEACPDERSDIGRCNLLSGSFFVSFLDKQKRKEKTEGHINVIKIKMGRE